MYNAFCECSGQTLDCLDVPGGFALPGTPCDDANAGTENDVYTVGCECVGTIITSIEEGTGSNAWFTVQPNPSNGKFQLNALEVNTAMSIAVYDATGRVVKAPILVSGKRTLQMDLEDMASGVYHVLATRNGQQRAIRIMVQH